MFTGTVRSATIDDAGRISRLLTELAREFIVAEFSEEGRRHLLAEFTVAAIAARLASDEYRFHVAEDGAALAGVVSIRRKTHLYYLFVARPQQRSGLARQLWLLARDEAVLAGNAAGRFTVNASRYAVGAYERLGFSRAGPLQEVQGVRFQPMEWAADRSGGATAGWPEALTTARYLGTLVPNWRRYMTGNSRKLVVERVQTGVRLERRILKVLKALAEYKDMSLGDLVEGIVLHSFDGKSPFAADTLKKIRDLKSIYGLDLDSSASHRMKERP